MTEYLKLNNISKSYDEKQAVKSLSLSVPERSIYGLIGPNGAGKTTTIRMIMNIIAPDSGEVLLKGQKVGEDFKDRVGYLPEERGLYKKMLVPEVIKFMARLKGYESNDWQGETDYWLAKMNLADTKAQKVEELSKGMQQKLQFITTVFHKPEIIILDELFSGLDPINIELVKNTLFELRDKGATILFSTHVMEQAEKMCDYIAMIRDGEKMLDGRMGEVKAQFGKNSIQIVYNGDVTTIKNHASVESVLEFPNYLEAKLKDGADHMTLLRDLSQNASITRFEKVEPSLYSIFLEVACIDPATDESSQLKGSAVNV